MSTILDMREQSLEGIVIKLSPYDTSAVTIHAFIVKMATDVDSDGSNVVEIGNLALGQAATVQITIPVFMERANVLPGAVYPCEVIADKDGDNPVVLASGEDLFIRLGEVASL